MCLEPRLGAKSGLRAPDFPFELMQQFLSFEISMGIVIQEDVTITQHARAFESDGFTMPSAYFLYWKLKERLS
ncbi:hypothetical protein AVEN_156654-1, partial [Araneus ventricosus]